MNLGSRTSWARSKCSTITRDGRPLNTSYESHQVLGSAIHHQSYYTCVLKLQSYDVLNSLDWVRNQRQRHTNPTIYSTLDCFIKQKESILEYNPLLILPYIWWLWPRTIPKIWWFFNPWNSPAVGKPRKPPERFVHLLATSKGLQLNTTVHGFTQGLANDWAGNENRIFDRWQKKWWCLPYDTLT
jgi:hypothetical protein